ncbi:hypothetical protein BRADI_2g22875v3 [Brachypodium distachyon]|uniref:Uncharacterized protein n=1 Tax=Brachypodium distachyon TaxID=15368 RepID=A0A0Q3QXF6_BRADI|nr:hypothetical protein BRADI_2g22875v3 [Brachypodium distachyon]
MRRIPRLAPPSFPSASIPSGRRLHPLPHDPHRPPSHHRSLPASQTSLQRPLLLIRATDPFVPPPPSRGRAGAADSLPPFCLPCDDAPPPPASSSSAPPPPPPPPPGEAGSSRRHPSPCTCCFQRRQVSGSQHRFHR